MFWAGFKEDIVPRENWQWPEYPCQCLLSLASSDRGQMPSVVILHFTGNDAVVGPQSGVCYRAPVSPNLWLGLDQIMCIVQTTSLCVLPIQWHCSLLPTHHNSELLPKASPVMLTNQEPSATGSSRLCSAKGGVPNLLSQDSARILHLLRRSTCERGSACTQEEKNHYAAVW